jgi:NAD(P)H dehydrogenase (quinone)
MVGQPGHKMMRRAILGFSGVKPVRTTVLGSVRQSTAEVRQRWLVDVRALGERDGSGRI